VPARNSATPASPGRAGYKWPNLHYLNANGQEVNTAAPGGDIDTSEYDRFGNVVRTLEATDRALALGALPGTADLVEQCRLVGLDRGHQVSAVLGVADMGV
jgi:hypothetical protein